MSIKIQKSLLTEAIRTIRPGLSSKETDGAEQSDCICFMDGQLVAFNDTICVHTKLAGIKDTTAAIHAQEFIQAVDKSKADKEGNLILSFDDKELVIKAGVEGKQKKALIGLKLHKEVKLPSSKVIAGIGQWVDMHPDLIQAMEFCIPTASKGMTKPIWQALGFAEEFVSSTDGYRISRFFLDDEPSELITQIPAASLAKMLTMPFNPCQYAIANNFVHFSDGMENTIFSCRTMMEDFPHKKIDKLLFIEGEEVIFPEDIRASLERCAILKPKVEQDEEVRITMTKGNLAISAEANFGWMEDTMESEYDGPDLEFIISPRSLYFILGHTQKAVISEAHLEFETKQFVHSICLSVKE